MINAIIMASGYGRRMGKNKLLLSLHGKYIIEYILDTVKQCSFKDVVLVGRGKKILDIAERKGIRVIKNDRAINGQSQSIKLGINNLSCAEGYMFFTGDQPLVDVETIEALLNKFYENKHCIIVPKYEEKRGNPVIFPAEFKSELLNLKGDMGGREIIKNYGDRIYYVSIEREEILFDVDTPEDYERLLHMKLK